MSLLEKNSINSQKEGKLTQIFKYQIEPIIENLLYLVGIVIILVGSIDSIRRGIIEEKKGEKSTDKILTDIRIELSETLTLALTFILGAEIVKSFRVPNIYQLIKITVLVLLRQLITFFLDKDVERLKKRK